MSVTELNRVADSLRVKQVVVNSLCATRYSTAWYCMAAYYVTWQLPNVQYIGSLRLPIASGTQETDISRKLCLEYKLLWPHIYSAVIDSFLRGLKAWLQYFYRAFLTWFMAVVGHEDTNKTTESLLYMSAPPIYLLLNHTQTTPPTST